MLYEIKKINQLKDEHFCRWFMDDFFDLFVWYDSDQSFFGFQLCYNKNVHERALTWWERSGYSHHKVDDGDITGGIKMTVFSYKLISEHFSGTYSFLNRFFLKINKERQ